MTTTPQLSNQIEMCYFTTNVVDPLLAVMFYSFCLKEQAFSVINDRQIGSYIELSSGMNCEKGMLQLSLLHLPGPTSLCM